MELILPNHAHNIDVQVSGGARSLTITRPTGTEVQLIVNGGIKNLSLDGQSVEKADTAFRKETSGFMHTSKRYYIKINGGASNLNLDTY